MTERKFNIISKLKYSKTKITLITILVALITFPLPIAMIIIFPSDITAWISGFVFLAMLIMIKPIEDNWLHRTKIIGQAIISEDWIKLNDTTFYWTDIKDVTIERYINLGYATMVSYWKDSYKMKLKGVDNTKTIILISKKSIDNKKIDLIKTLISIKNIDFKTRKELKKKIH